MVQSRQHRIQLQLKACNLRGGAYNDDMCFIIRSFSARRGLFVLALLFVLLTAFLAGQEQPGLSLGGYVVNQYALGSYAEHAVAQLGGGLTVDWMPAWTLPMNLGARLQLSKVIPTAGSVLSGAWNLGLLGGAGWSLPFGTAFSLRPWLGWGLQVQGNSGEVQGVYVSQQVQAEINLRLSSGNLSMEIVPQYSLLPQSGGAIHLLGMRTGILVQLGGGKAATEGIDE